MKNRLAGANDKLPSDKAMKSAGRGTSSELSAEDGKLCVVKWYDNKPVLLMSVVHSTQPEDTCQGWDKKLKQYVTVSRPSIVREYNTKMIDRMISYDRMSTRMKKWTMQMIMHFTDLPYGYSTAKTIQYVLDQRQYPSSSLSSVWKWQISSWPSITVQMLTYRNNQRKKMHNKG